MDDNQKFIEKRLENLENSLQRQEEKLNNLEKLINKVLGISSTIKVKDEIKVDENVQPQSFESPIQNQEENTSFEENFGQKWLSKIGIALFALGVGFLISYSFKFFGPVLKILFGYIISSILFFVGNKLEVKKNLVNYGRVIMGGAWAIVYFTTYAMYHFPATKVINSQLVDLFLLAIVVVGIMRHVLYYKSESLMAVAFLVAYLTSTISTINNFTIISNLFLAILILFFVYRFQWVKILIFGMVFTYGIHNFWISPKIAYIGGSLFNFIFLSCYWLVFLIGIHLIKSQNQPKYSKTLAAINFGNIALYNILAYSLVSELFFYKRFDFFFLEGVIYLILALVMKKNENKDLYISDLAAGIFIMTFSISLKFLPNISLVVWLIELPFLLLIGSKFQEKVFRYLAYVLCGYVFLQINSIWIFNNSQWQDYFHLLSAVSMGACFCIMQFLKDKFEINDFDRFFDYVFSFLFCCFLGFWVNSWISDSWRGFAFYLQALLFFGISIFFNRFRSYSYIVLAIASFISLFSKIEYEKLGFLIISFNTVVFFIIYYALQYLKKLKMKETYLGGESTLLLFFSLATLLFNVNRYVYSQWISLVLGLCSVVIIFVGFLNQDKKERIGGIILLGITLLRVFMIDLSDLNIIFKIVTFMVLGCLFLGVSYVYNRFNLKKSE